ncbi:MAG: zinc ribbon domain-containing protein [Anaerolineales bacterium]
MIRCSKCGALNRDGSRFCNDCGAPLQKTHIRCPACGTMNPVVNVYCDHCHARLVTSEGMVPPRQMAEETVELPVRMQGISLPTRAAADDIEEEGEDETPPWLHELISSGGEGEVPPDVEGEEGLARADLPDWLSGLDVEEDGEGGEVLNAGSEKPATASDEELPDWLSDLSDEPEPEVPSRRRAESEVLPANDSEEELPDWLSGLLPEEEVEEFASAAEPQGAELEAEDLPEWLTGLEEPQEEEVAPEMEPVAEGELPDWLQAAGADSVEEYAAEEPFEEEDEELPDWLSGAAPAGEAEPAEASGAEELPDWLGGSAPETAEPFEEEDEELPDWLSGAAPAGEAEPAEASGAEELPDWLGGSAPETAEPFEEEVAEGAVPEWLAGSVLEEEAPAEAEAEEVPDWLAGLEGPPGAVEEAEEVAPAGALPDWLSDLEPPAEVGEQLSPFATGDREERGALFGGTPGSESAPDAEEEPREGEVPNWLRDISPPPPAVVPGRAVNAFVGEEDEQEDEEDFEADEEEDVFEAAESLGEAEIPEWLKSLSPGEGEVAYEPPVEGLAQADMPSWLQSLKPPGTGPLPQTGPLSEQEAARAEEEGGLARAEIPDWVQQLRPTGEVVEEVSPFEVAEREPPVVEGPLAGLEGVLPALGLVDVPEDFTVQRAPPLPESTVEEAQLWQHLLEQPRGRERPVARGRQEQPGWQEVLLRLFILVMITAAGVLAIWEVLPGIWAQPPDLPGVEVLAAALDTHGPGDSVVLAVEYSTAYAGELDTITLALLDQLEEQEVQVYAVTTRPEGQALIERLFAGREELLLGSTYLPGGAAAIVPFLQSVEVERLVVVGGQATRLRWWVEQNATLGGERLPMSMGMSAAAGPFMTPYLNAWNVDGWVIGYAGVAGYRDVQGLPPADEITRPLQGLMFGQWGAALFILLGALYYLVTGKRRA